MAVNFNPRSPHGERPPPALWQQPLQDFNPRSPHGERPGQRQRGAGSRHISIHAPRTGSDRRASSHLRRGLPISIHAPRTGSDQLVAVEGGVELISIHAPRTGSDLLRR